MQKILFVKEGLTTCIKRTHTVTQRDNELSADVFCLIWYKMQICHT